MPTHSSFSLGRRAGDEGKRGEFFLVLRVNSLELKGTTNIKNCSDTELVQKFAPKRVIMRWWESCFSATHIWCLGMMKYFKDEDEAKDGVMQDLRKDPYRSASAQCGKISKAGCIWLLRTIA